MGFAPVITRLYGPEAFGMLGTFMAVLGVLTPIAALTYPIAIVLPESDAEAKNIAKLSATLALVIAAITALVLLVAGGWIADALGLSAITGLLMLIPVAMFFSALQQILTQWLIRKKQFKITAKVAIVQALAINAAKVVSGFSYPSGAILILITAAGHAFNAVLLWAGARNFKTANMYPEQRAHTFLELAREYRDFSLYRAPQVALNSLAKMLPVLVLASSFGPANAGFFVLTKSVLAAPAGLIGASVANVFYPKAAELRGDPSSLRSFLFRTTASLVLLGGLVFSPVIFLGPWLFGSIFGQEWTEAGEFARWVSLWMVFSLAAGPVITTIPVIGMQKDFLMFEIYFLPVKVLSLYVGVYLNSSIVAVSSYCIVSCAFYISLYGLVFRGLSRLKSG